MAPITYGVSMSAWLLRAVVMLIVWIAARIILGAVIISDPLSTNTGRTVTLIILAIIPLIWGGIDGLRDARANPDPDDYTDLTVRWIKAGFVAGLVSCLVCWIIGTFWLNGIGQASFWIEIFAGTSFVCLMIYIPAFIGVSFSRALIRRETRKKERISAEEDEAALGLAQAQDLTHVRGV